MLLRANWVICRLLPDPHRLPAAITIPLPNSSRARPTRSSRQPVAWAHVCRLPQSRTSWCHRRVGPPDHTPLEDLTVMTVATIATATPSRSGKLLCRDGFWVLCSNCPYYSCGPQDRELSIRRLPRWGLSRNRIRDRTRPIRFARANFRIEPGREATCRQACTQNRIPVEDQG